MRPLRITVLLLTVIMAAVFAGCASTMEIDDVQAEMKARALVDVAVSEAELTLPEGYEALTIVDGLNGPTQMVKGPDGLLWVAQIGGGENEGKGQVLAIDIVTGEQRVVVGELLKPTGIALTGGYLWIATKRDIVRAPLDEEYQAGALEVVHGNLPFDGRSNGTLTLVPDGGLVYETSGVRFGGSPIADSATLWWMHPAAPEERRALATGLKSAYAHAIQHKDWLWFTEISSDLVNGKHPPDELNVVRLTGDLEVENFGWPKCYGEREPAFNYGGDVATCLRTKPPAMLFEPRSTPTGIVSSPWRNDRLIVALWGRGELVQVDVTYHADSATGTASPFVSGLQHPQDILVWDSATILVTDYGSGKIYAISRIDGGPQG